MLHVSNPSLFLFDHVYNIIKSNIFLENANCYNQVFSSFYLTLRKGKQMVITKGGNNKGQKANRVNKVRQIFLILTGIDLSLSHRHFPLLGA